MKHIDELSAKAVKEIEGKCYSLDIKGNNCQLDRIMRKFLLDIGQPELEKAFNDVECWKCIQLGKREKRQVACK